MLRHAPRAHCRWLRVGARDPARNLRAYPPTTSACPPDISTRTYRGPRRALARRALGRHRRRGRPAPALGRSVGQRARRPPRPAPPAPRPAPARPVRARMSLPERSRRLPGITAITSSSLRLSTCLFRLNSWSSSASEPPSGHCTRMRGRSRRLARTWSPRCWSPYRSHRSVAGNLITPSRWVSRRSSSPRCPAA